MFLRLGSAEQAKGFMKMLFAHGILPESYITKTDTSITAAGQATHTLHLRGVVDEDKAVIAEHFRPDKLSMRIPNVYLTDSTA